MSRQPCPQCGDDGSTCDRCGVPALFLAQNLLGRRDHWWCPAVSRAGADTLAPYPTAPRAAVDVETAHAAYVEARNAFDAEPCDANRWRAAHAALDQWRTAADDAQLLSELDAIDAEIAALEDLEDRVDFDDFDVLLGERPPLQETECRD